MDRKRFIAEQIIVKIREAEIIESKGLTQVEAAKKLRICEQTLIRWSREYGGLRIDQSKGWFINRCYEKNLLTNFQAYFGR